MYRHAGSPSLATLSNERNAATPRRDSPATTQLEDKGTVPPSVIAFSTVTTPKNGERQVRNSRPAEEILKDIQGSAGTLIL